MAERARHIQYLSELSEIFFSCDTSSLNTQKYGYSRHKQRPLVREDILEGSMDVPTQWCGNGNDDMYLFQVVRRRRDDRSAHHHGHVCAVDVALMAGDSRSLVPPTLTREQKSKEMAKKDKGHDEEAEDYDLYVYSGVFSTIAHRYLRLLCYDDTTDMYSETGYEKCP
ncbi:hypothetical protein J6590_017912 [Homalodisca vitripennis]|nr:hypothetical protein J6590_017912 [Homalodisca vitripennis]